MDEGSCVQNTPSRIQQAGFSLVEVMVSMGISTIIMLGFATYLNYQGQSIKGMQGMSSRDAIVVNLRTLAGMGTALRSTADYLDGSGNLVNPELNAMIYPGDQGAAGPDCDTAWHDLALYSPQRVSWGDPLGAPNGDLVAGKWDSETSTSVLHKRYQLEGAPCPDGTAASDLCPIDAYTRFRAVRCSGVEQAELIEVGYKVRQNPDVDIKRATLRLRDESGSTFLEVGAILEDNIVQCPNPDQVMMGWDMKGDAICVTMTAAEGTPPSCGPRQVLRGYSSINMDPDGDPATNDAVMVPICEDIACASDEVFNGFDADGTVTGVVGGQICVQRDSTPVGTYIFSDLTPAQFHAQPGYGTNKWHIADGANCTGTDYASVSGKSTIPNFLGLYPRAKSYSSGVDPRGDRSTGSRDLTSTVGAHTHPINDPGHSHDVIDSKTGDFAAWGDKPGSEGSQVESTKNSSSGRLLAKSKKTGITVQSNSGSETQPKDIIVNVFIKINDDGNTPCTGGVVASPPPPSGGGGGGPVVPPIGGGGPVGPPGGGGGCFLAGTRILTEQGDVPIEDIGPGTRVWSMSVDGELRTNPVNSLIRYLRTDGYWIVELSNGNQIHVTGDHPFWSVDVGDYVAIQDLESGSQLLLFDGNIVEIVNRQFVAEMVNVYNMEVARDHNYFSERVLVHNKKAPIEPPSVPYYP